MDKKVEKFKADFKDLKARAKLIKQKLRDLKKEAKSLANAADRLYERGNNTMYMDVTGSGIKWTPKFNGLGDMMDIIERFMWFDTIILQAIDDMP